MCRPPGQFSDNWKSRLGLYGSTLLVLGLVWGTAVADTPRVSTGNSADEETPEPLRPGLVERAQAELGLVEVVVLDRKGRHVRGVPPSAFRLTSGDEELRVVSVDEIDLALRSGDEIYARSRDEDANQPWERGQPGLP